MNSQFEYKETMNALRFTESQKAEIAARAAAAAAASKHSRTRRPLGRMAVIAAAVAYTIVLLFVFPLVASVSNTNWAMLKNSFFIGTHYLFCTILVFAVHFAMFFLVVSVFTPLIIFGEGLCALLSAYLMNNVLRACSYDPEEEGAPEAGGDI